MITEPLTESVHSIRNLFFILMTVLALSATAEETSDPYTNLFRSMKINDEPSLTGMCKDDYEAVRFFEFDNAEPKGLVRVERSAAGVRYTYRSYHRDGRSQTTSQIIEEKDWRKILQLFDSGGFANDESGPALWVPHTMTWLFESCLSGQYASMRSYPKRDLRMNDAVEALVALKL